MRRFLKKNHFPACKIPPHPVDCPPSVNHNTLQKEKTLWLTTLKLATFRPVLKWLGKDLRRSSLLSLSTTLSRLRLSVSRCSSPTTLRWKAGATSVAATTVNPLAFPVSESYQALTNGRFWEIVQNAVGGTGAVIESAGTIYDRCRRFITVKLGTDLDTFNVGDREFKNRFSLLDSIDGSTNFYGVNSSTCVVCANTFQMVMGDTTGEFRFKIRHSKNLLPKIENMEKAIDQFIGVTAQF